MWKSRGFTRLVPSLTLALIAAATACSSSTSPGSSGKVTTPGNAAKGDTINLVGTYALASYTDSSNGGATTIPVDANDGGTLVLTSNTVALTWTGTLAANNGSGVTGTYTAVDTSTAVDRGTITIVQGSKTQNGTYQLSTDTLTISLASNEGGALTVWIKQ